MLLRTGFLFLAFVSSAALAQPSSRLSELDPFIGNWRCSGTALASHFGPEHPTAATIRVEWVLGRHWLNARYTESKTEKNQKPASGHVHWGFDEKKKKFTGYAVNNFGGHVTIESDGWNGDTIVWNGSMNVGGMTMTTRDTFVRRSPREIGHKTEAEMNGQWVLLNEEKCRKTS